MEAQLGIAHFLLHIDGLGKTLLAVLFVMSATTWSLIAMKATAWVGMRRRTRRFLDRFWSSASLEAVERDLERHVPDEPFSNLVRHAIIALRHHERHHAGTPGNSSAHAELLTRSIRRVIDEETARFESGLSALASIGSTAPFVGLFGTVWGVYQALVTIGMTGQSSLDKVAGPVGEALIMTALGLAVAIPAVLAYNFAVRRNRLVLAQLDAFAHDLFAFLTTGAHVTALRQEVESPNARPAQGAA